MNFYELKPTDENISKSLSQDQIKRNSAIARFMRLLNNINTSCSISLDGNWGCGKTFFIKQAQMLINAAKQNVGDTKIQNIVTKYDLNELKKKQFCIYFDAWKNDATKEPVLALIYEITKQYFVAFPKNISKGDLIQSAKTILSGLSIGVAWNAVSISLNGLVKAFDDLKDDPTKEIEKDDILHQNINNFFEQILPINDTEKYDRIVIFIDELDRCRPTFALQLLERIKHYFDQEYITFVFSTNMKELCKTVKTYYGADFDAERYLDKFFDLRLQLPQISIGEYINKLTYGNSEMNKLSNIFKRVSEFCGLEMREITRFLKIYEIAANQYWGYYQEDASPTTSRLNKEIGRCKDYILPLLIGLKMTNSFDYEDFINGKGPELFEEFLSDPSCEPFFDEDDRKKESDEFYKFIFKPDEYHKKHKQVLLDSLTLIGMFSYYQ